MFQIVLLVVAALVLIVVVPGYFRVKRDQADLREMRRLQKARLMRQGSSKDTDKAKERKRRYREVRMVPPEEALTKPGGRQP